MAIVADVHLAMVRKFRSDLETITHLFTVHGFAMTLAAAEKVDGDRLQILEIAALTHCIGLDECKRKFKIITRKGLESEGAPLTRGLLEDLKCSEEVIEEVCFLVGKQHTYTEIASIEHQILVEAFFLATANEKQWTKQQVESFCDRVFKTETGKFLLGLLY